MSRHDDQRLADILASAEAITAHTQRGNLDDGLIYDAVRMVVRASVHYYNTCAELDQLIGALPPG